MADHNLIAALSYRRGAGGTPRMSRYNLSAG
jgi:hypothetical protein